MRSLIPFVMDRSQSLNAPPYFDGSNYAFWKFRMRAFLCSIDETIWDVVDVGWTRLKAAKSIWDKAALAAANTNSKVLNAIFSILITTRFIIKNFIITKGYSHRLTLRSQECWTFRFHMTIPLTSKTLLTHRIIRGLTYFLFRFFSVINLNGINVIDLISLALLLLFLRKFLKFLAR